VSVPGSSRKPWDIYFHFVGGMEDGGNSRNTEGRSAGCCNCCRINHLVLEQRGKVRQLVSSIDAKVMNKLIYELSLVVG